MSDRNPNRKAASHSDFLYGSNDGTTSQGSSSHSKTSILKGLFSRSTAPSSQSASFSSPTPVTSVSGTPFRMHDPQQQQTQQQQQQQQSQQSQQQQSQQSQQQHNVSTPTSSGFPNPQKQSGSSQGSSLQSPAHPTTNASANPPSSPSQNPRAKHSATPPKQPLYRDANTLGNMYETTSTVASTVISVSSNSGASTLGRHSKNTNTNTNTNTQQTQREALELRSQLQEAEVDLNALVNLLVDASHLISRLTADPHAKESVPCSVSRPRVFRSNIQTVANDFVAKVEQLCEVWPNRSKPASRKQSRDAEILSPEQIVVLNQAQEQIPDKQEHDLDTYPARNLETHHEDYREYDAVSMISASTSGTKANMGRRTSEFVGSTRRSSEYHTALRRSSEYLPGLSRNDVSFDAPSTIYPMAPVASGNIDAEEDLAERSISSDAKPSGKSGSSSSSALPKQISDKTPDKFAKSFFPPTLPESNISKIGFRTSAIHLNCDHKGWLLKKSELKKKHGKSIYVAIRHWRLFSFDSEKDNFPADEVDLSQCVVFLPLVDDDGVSICIATSSKIYIFSCPTTTDRSKWLSVLLSVSDEARCLLETSLATKNTKQIRQGYLLLYKKDLDVTPELKWCFASESYFGYFQGPKRCRIIDLARANILTSPNRRLFTLSYDSKTYHWMPVSATDLDLWYSCTSRLIEIAKSSITSDGAWQGFLSKKSKGVLGRNKELWFVLKDGVLTCYSDIKSVNPIARYELQGATLREIDTLTLELILVDANRLQLSSGSHMDFSLCRSALKKNISEGQVKKDGSIRSGNLNISRASSSGKLKKEPKLYWVVLTKDTFSYYKNQQDTSSKKSFHLSTVRLLKTRSSATDCSFFIQLPKKTIKVVAANHQLAMQWKEDIRVAINTLELEARKKKAASTKKITMSYSSLRIDPTSMNEPAIESRDLLRTSSRKINTLKSDDDTTQEKDDTPKDDTVHLEGPFTIIDAKQKRRNSVPPKLTHKRISADTGHVLVIDNGASFTRVGFHSSPVPQTVVPTVVGYRSIGSIDEFSVGFNVFKQQEAVGSKIEKPYDVDAQINWDVMADIYSHVVEFEFNADICNHPIVLTKPTGHREGDEIKLVELLMEGFQAPAVLVTDPGPLPIFGMNKKCGLSVDIGTRTQVTAVYEHFALPEANFRSSIGGRYIDTCLQKLLSDDLNFYISPRKVHTVVASLKESLCYVSADYQQEMDEWNMNRVSKRRPFTYDKRTIMIGSQRFRAPELLFNPRIAGHDLDGVADMVGRAISSCDIHLRREICQNIVLSGGTTLLPGFADRLQFELKEKYPQLPPVRISEPHHRKYLTWFGAANIATDSTYADYWITADQYWEEGVRELEDVDDLI
eukprot:TRINITY_DN3641_c0_g1_i1.p1 TRINITY_DN3641_c0_g1~~TRINITY_DN3641_c0_g1_i1.p1  ORF type:complete len:1371 (+),score=278.16 TRINITY_DN3641_c0_g1_i1:55-4167(+)